jgi:pimeloyl-ACP methyl ester carboxylesterase
MLAAAYQGRVPTSGKCEQMRLRASMAAAAAAVLIAIAGCSAGASSDPSAIKGSFDIGGRSLYLECSGTGTPTIVMDAGLGNDHTTWAKVVPEVRGANRTCTYDRANIGASDKATKPRTSSDVVDDLHRLLAAAKVPAPYILVGHSFAGMSMRLFASTYPTEVVALVLVDPTPPTFIDDECAIVSTSLCDTLRADSAASKNPDGLDIAGSAAALAAAGPLPAVPLVVLAATVHHQTTITDPAIEAQIEALWQRRLQELAASLPSGRIEVVTSGHDIQTLHPEAVVGALRSILTGPPTAS